MKQISSLALPTLLILGAISIGAQMNPAPQTATPSEPHGDCPDGPGAGEEDLLPLAVGAVWEFAYTYRNQEVFSQSAEAGTLTLQLLSETCADGVRTIRAEEHRVGRSTSTYLPPRPASEHDIDTVEEVVLVESAAGVLLPWSDGPVQRYWSATTDTVRTSAGNYVRCATPGSHADLLSGEGLVGYGAGCTRVSSSHRFNLRRLSNPVSTPGGPAAGTRLAVWPNPARGGVWVRGAAGEIEVFTVDGRQVRMVGTAREGATRVDLTGLPAGTYVVRAGRQSRVVTMAD